MHTYVVCILCIKNQDFLNLSFKSYIKVGITYKAKLFQEATFYGFRRLVFFPAVNTIQVYFTKE
jgi:hypothetical protein